MRAVALPPEHGAWGFLSESLLVGLIAAPSAAAGAVACAGFALFLLRHPFKIVVADRVLRGRFYPRTRQAAAFATLYGAVSCAALVAAGWLAGGWSWLVPLGIALPAGLLQMRAELRSEGRALLPELLGAGSAGSLAASCALASGWAARPAFLLWLLLALRSSSAIVYARTRLRLDRGAPASRGPAWVLHLAGAALAAGLTGAGFVPWGATVVFLVLLARSFWALGPWRRPIRPQRLGWQEMALGVASAVALGLSFTALRP